MPSSQEPVSFAAGRCLVVGEVAQVHDGSLGLAHALIDSVARAGADAVKFQTHIAEAESTAAEPWRVRFSTQDATRYDYWKRTSFGEREWQGLADHARERGLLFLSSAFSVQAVELLARVGVAAWKVASGELPNTPLLERMAETRLPFILSTGMSPLAEIDAAVDWLTTRALPLAVLQCTSAYPCPADSVGLNLIPLFRERYGCAVGLSDHSGRIYAGLAAATLGIEVLEVHVTPSREMPGPDTQASLTIEELRVLVEGVRFIERMRAHPVDKDAMAGATGSLRAIFTQSVVARVRLPAGTVLRPEHLTTKKPGTGIPAARLRDLVGWRLRREVQPDGLLRDEDIEEPE